jgi:YfiH family protein
MSPPVPRTVAERRRPGEVPLWSHPDWSERFPWLVQGTTGAGEAETPFDLGLFGARPVGEVMERWRRLREATEMPVAVHARQVHQAEVRAHDAPLPPGLVAMQGFDGHLTRQEGVLLTVSVADCVPVSLVDGRGRAVALVHAGWRGVAGGIVERAAREMTERYGTEPADVWLHCGPAICGACYEVGPEVHHAVYPEEAPPEAPRPIDLRAAIARRAAGLGMVSDRVTVSAHCTRCGPGAFFSHRGGSPARQMGLLGRRN